MKQFKLTDIEGKEFILHVPQETELRSRTPYVVPVEPPAPEIKEGMWVVLDTTDEDKVRRVLTVTPERLTYDNEGKTSHFEWQGYVRPATPAEIESHLQKVCEKYIGKEYRSIFSTGKLDSAISKFPVIPYWKYSRDGGDTFDCGHGYGWLYANGQFAEIIESKKKRPETREELDKMFSDFWDTISIDGPYKSESISKFLNEYDL